jgi:hypothetical protein
VGELTGANAGNEIGRLGETSVGPPGSPRHALPDPVLSHISTISVSARGGGCNSLTTPPCLRLQISLRVARIPHLPQHDSAREELSYTLE